MVNWMVQKISEKIAEVEISLCHIFQRSYDVKKVLRSFLSENNKQTNK